MLVPFIICWISLSLSEASLQVFPLPSGLYSKSCGNTFPFIGFATFTSLSLSLFESRTAMSLSSEELIGLGGTLHTLFLGRAA